MCGITGTAPGIEENILRQMTERLAHRGPDGEGYFSAPEVSFGHRRLAIIDVPGGAQPMTSADGRFTIVFNGEIYNFRELRAELESEGARFRTKSDTEVLLELFARRGNEATLEKLCGMFAFAVWDAQRKALFIARDRLGVKPMYYAVRGGRLLFASEMKALLAHPDVSRRMNARAVDDFLTYLYVPAPQTIFEDVSELPPAHWLEWKDSNLRVERYWDVHPSGPQPADASAVQLAEELRAQLDRAVRLRLVSDVPLGAFLSGGIDSSSIVALMARASAATVRSFSLGFGAGAEHYTELEYARKISRRYNTEHTELEIEAKCAELLPAMVAHFDEPFGNPTALLIYQLAELTRRYVTVALAGDAGDEVFLGYPRYHGVRLRRYLDLFPRAARRAIASLAGNLWENTNGFHARRRVREFLTTAGEHWKDAYASWVSYFSPAMRRELYTDEFRAAIGGYDSGAVLDEHFARVTKAAPLDQVSYVDLHTFLPYNLLEYGDRMSMAHALEMRLPFTDHRLVEFSMSVPAELKLRGRHTKYLLREAVRSLLPAEILERPKLGLNPPLGMWLKGELANGGKADGGSFASAQDKLKPAPTKHFAGLKPAATCAAEAGLLDRYLSEEAVRRRGWFRPEAVARLREDFSSGRRDYSLHLWALVVLEEWARQYA